MPIGIPERDGDDLSMQAIADDLHALDEGKADAEHVHGLPAGQTLVPSPPGTGTHHLVAEGGALSWRPF